jgi:hypothetical protein
VIFKLSLPSVEKTLGKEALCRFFAWHSAKRFFAKCLKKHSAKHLALSKEPNSGSDYYGSR